jgi:hypothetical protein
MQKLAFMSNDLCCPILARLVVNPETHDYPRFSGFNVYLC